MEDGKNDSELRSIVARVLAIPAEDVNDSVSMATTPTWDSFNALTLISEIEAAFATQLSTEDVMAIQSVDDIRKALQKNGIAL